MKLCLTSIIALLQLSVACTGTPPERTDATRTVAIAQGATPATPAAAVAPAATVETVRASVATASPSVNAPTSTSPVRTSAASALIVKRLVVTTGVKDREPLATTDALPANGSPIYAFVELANPVGPSENVRITFERKGAKERVGDVTLPVPGSTPRHRTWAFTRFIRTPGQWDAVLWGENGVELGRTSFEVSAS